jgi:hypothetical protein
MYVIGYVSLTSWFFCWMFFILNNNSPCFFRLPSDLHTRLEALEMEPNERNNFNKIKEYFNKRGFNFDQLAESFRQFLPMRHKIAHVKSGGNFQKRLSTKIKRNVHLINSLNERQRNAFYTFEEAIGFFY